jgi:hypothetical protein
MRAVTLLCLVVLTAGALGCGDTNGQSASVSEQPASAPPLTGTDAVPTTATPTATTPAATTPAPAATTPAPAATTPSTTPTATTGEPAGAGAGDEEPARTPADFVIGPGGVTPSSVTAAAFLSIDVSLTSKTGAHQVTIDAPGGGTFAVAAGGTRHVVLAGLKPGDYPITVDGGGRATLHVVSGGAPGP